VGLNPDQAKTKDYKIGICCFSAKHAALRRKSRLAGSKVVARRFDLDRVYYIKCIMYVYFLFLLYNNHNKFQVHVLKSLIEVQEYYKQKTHQKQTEEKLQNLKHKLNVSSDDELSVRD
jgi:hypothetical protein